MPHALIALEDVYESVIRRISIDSISQLAQIMRLPPETAIRLPGNAESVPMNNGMFKPCDDPGINYPTGGRLVVNFTEETSEDHTLVTHPNRSEHLPVFWDEHRDIIVRPVYRTVIHNLNLEYIAPNQNLAQRWLDEMRSRISMQRAELYQTLEYHFAIPSPVLHLLHHLHTTKEASPTPDGDDFKTYLDKYLFRPTTTAETLIGTAPTRVIQEKQFEVIGWFDFSDSPVVPEKDGNESGAYRASFSYRFQYDRPMQMYCRWPMVVHNKAIAPQYRPQEPYETFRQAHRRVTFTKGSFESLMDNMRAHGIPYLIHPDVDDWTPDTPPKGVLTFFSGLLVLNPNHPRRLVDLFNLGPYTFMPYFLEYFYQQRHTLFGPSSSPFEFRLYQSGHHKTDVSFSFEAGSLRLHANEDLDPTYQYHIQISIRRNWRLLSPDTIQCLRRYPMVTYLTLLALGVKLGNGTYPELSVLGAGTPRTVSEQCPGEGSLLGPPEAGGTWPWPWLGDEWTNTPWPGYGWNDPDSDRNPWDWPGGNNNGFNPGYPTWPGSTFPPGLGDPTTWPPGPGPGGSWPPGTWPGGGSVGIIRDKDMQEAIDKTDRLQDKPVDRTLVGPLSVLYSEIIALHRS